ncbi:MAG: two-component system sensor histidine kinase NtrB [Chitinophagaceae bacterium]
MKKNNFGDKEEKEDPGSGKNELSKIAAQENLLKNKEKLLISNRIARTIAHEIRNPLTNISLASDQLKEAGTQDEDSILLHSMISRSIGRINQLLSELLNATRFEPLDYTTIDINALVDETLRELAVNIEQQNIEIVRSYEKLPFEIRVDKEKIKLAFSNIISNAIESMKENDSGVLEIRIYSQHYNKCIIEFKDKGIGIKGEFLQDIFEPYFTTKIKGSGLGLTQSQNIILNHKGNIQVKSKVGSGTVFFVTLNTNENLVSD